MSNLWDRYILFNWMFFVIRGFQKVYKYIAESGAFCVHNKYNYFTI